MPLLTFRLAGTWAAWPAAAAQSFMLEVDWAGDGSFLGGDVSAHTVGPVQTVRGRDYASQLSGRSVAGKLTATLRNNDGRYSSFNAASPLYGLIRPGLRVRAWVIAPFTEVLWTGRLDTLEPVLGPEPVARLEASGVLKQLGDQANLVSVAPITSGAVSDAVDDVLDAAGFPAADRDVEASVIPLAHWYVEQKPALQALQELEETEVGFLLEGLDFDVVFQNRYHRNIVGRSALVHFSDSLSSNTPYIDIVQNEPVRDIYNHLSAEVTPYTTAALAVLWSLPIGDPATGEAPPYLAPGASLTYRATYTDGYVNPWTTPALALDVVGAGGTLAVSGVVKTAQGMSFTVSNSHATQGATLSVVQARGVAYAPQIKYQVEASDAASQAKYGRRSYPLTSPWYPNRAYAQAAIDYFLNLRKDAHPVLSLTLANANPTGTFYALAEQMGTRRLSDLVGVQAQSILTQLGIAPGAPDFYIESIAHVFGGAMPWTTTFTLAPVSEPMGTNYWIIGDTSWGSLGVTTNLAY